MFSYRFNLLCATLLLVFVSLAQPLQAAPNDTFTVINTNDVGAGSLRQAILDANANGGLDNIFFNIPGAGVHTIQPQSALPIISDAVIIDGLTQSGADCSSWPPTLQIELDGSNAGVAAFGINITAGNSVVSGLVINNFDGRGINLRNGGGNIIGCNYVGTDTSGTMAQGNGKGVVVENSADNFIGTIIINAVRGNLISGNDSEGVLIADAGATGNLVQANFIGTTPDGASDLGNGTIGVLVTNRADDNTIGSMGAGRNIISGNGAWGINVIGIDLDGTIIQNNYIGTDQTGMNAIPNDEYGVYLNNATTALVGGDSAEKRNVIAGNTLGGIWISGILEDGNHRVEGNYIGVAADGFSALGNGDDGCGVDILDSASNTIGNGLASGRNTIAGNKRNVCVTGDASDGNQILGNFIGVDATSSLTLGGEIGIYVTDADETLIDGNVISGHERYGIRIDGDQDIAMLTVITNNQIGTNDLGLAALPNEDEGILVGDAVANTLIGGTAANAGNLISGNLGIAILIYGDETTVQGNLIGTNSSGLVALPNASGIGMINAGNSLIGGGVPAARNIIAGNQFSGVTMTAPNDATDLSGNMIAGNYIGIGNDGSTPLSNGAYGILMVGGEGNTIGGDSAEFGNVIASSGNDGILLRAADYSQGNTLVPVYNTKIAFNYIGTTADGMSALPNVRNGIRFSADDDPDTPSADVYDNVIHDNLISGNGRSGIIFTDAEVRNNQITHNKIGSDVTGIAPLGNVRDGVASAGGPTLIGGSPASVEGNIIAFNGEHGVTIYDPCIHVLCEPHPGPVTQNTILGNSIHSNDGLGIELHDDGVTLNDLNDVDFGLPNHWQNFPVLSMATQIGADLQIEGTFNSISNASFTIEYFVSPSCDDSGFGEGALYLASDGLIMTDNDGNAVINITVPNTQLPVGSALTATATDADGNTSEFSRCLEIDTTAVMLSGGGQAQNSLTPVWAAVLLLLAVSIATVGWHQKIGLGQAELH